jgi:hypothetical protein
MLPSIAMLSATVAGARQAAQAGLKWDYQRCYRVVAYPLLADNVSRPLPSRPRRLTQPVMSPPHGFSAPRPPLLACI